MYDGALFQPLKFCLKFEAQTTYTYIYVLKTRSVFSNVMIMDTPYHIKRLTCFRKFSISLSSSCIARTFD